MGVRDLTKRRNELDDRDNQFSLAVVRDPDDIRNYVDKVDKAKVVEQKTEEEYQKERAQEEMKLFAEFFELDVDESDIAAVEEDGDDVSKNLEEKSGYSSILKDAEEKTESEIHKDDVNREIKKSNFEVKDSWENYNEDLSLDEWLIKTGNKVVKRLEVRKEPKSNKPYPTTFQDPNHVPDHNYRGTPIGEDPNGLFEQQVYAEGGSFERASDRQTYSNYASTKSTDRHQAQPFDDPKNDQKYREKMERKAKMYSKGNGVMLGAAVKAAERNRRVPDEAKEKRFFSRRRVTMRSMWKDTVDTLKTKKAQMVMKVGAMVSMQTMMGMMSRQHEFDDSKQMFVYIGMMLGVFMIGYELAQDGIDPRNMQMV